MLSEQRLKNLVKQLTKEYNIAPQQLYSLYGLEQILDKISHSEYQKHFVLKGGFLLSSVYGLNSRATKDLDTTIRGLSLTDSQVNEFSNFIESVDSDGIKHFKVNRIKKIREDFDYDGYNLRITFSVGNSKHPLEIDMTSGEKLLPLVENAKLQKIFGEGEIEIPAYPIEQILADKLYTTLSYGAIDDNNSRAKDLYDIYFLTKMSRDVDYKKVYAAIENAKQQRSNLELEVNHYVSIVDRLKESDTQRLLWNNFQERSSFAEGISFSEIMERVRQLAGTMSTISHILTEEKKTTINNKPHIKKTKHIEQDWER